MFHRPTSKGVRGESSVNPTGSNKVPNRTVHEINDQIQYTRQILQNHSTGTPNKWIHYKNSSDKEKTKKQYSTSTITQLNQPVFFKNNGEKKTFLQIQTELLEILSLNKDEADVKKEPGKIVLPEPRKHETFDEFNARMNTRPDGTEIRSKTPWSKSKNKKNPSPSNLGDILEEIVDTQKSEEEKLVDTHFKKNPCLKKISEDSIEMEQLFPLVERKWEPRQLDLVKPKLTIKKLGPTPSEIQYEMKQELDFKLRLMSARSPSLNPIGRDSQVFYESAHPGGINGGQFLVPSIMKRQWVNPKKKVIPPPPRKPTRKTIIIPFDSSDTTMKNSEPNKVKASIPIRILTGQGQPLVKGSTTRVPERNMKNLQEHGKVYTVDEIDKNMTLLKTTMTTALKTNKILPHLLPHAPRNFKPDKVVSIKKPQ